ncbi:hypothetical protein COC42_16280 [Sphingomonas spermidinifaciens]|uniref:Peroxiredoxin n=1 Tax=Sphingomonas spermidinifaciens TaxID=1141889 RepID=A0A2A4B1W0_9SPHN|nr:hypothetical protein COC42_16280 [Sphingomonas spermidinifaciens]
MLADSALVAALEEAAALGVAVSLCPTGLADAAIDPPPVPEAERYGLVTLLAELEDDARLLVI